MRADFHYRRALACLKEAARQSDRLANGLSAILMEVHNREVQLHIANRLCFDNTHQQYESLVYRK